MTEDTFIYVLVDPRTSIVRYVGKADNPTKRLVAHLTPSGRRENIQKGAWIDELESINTKPIIQVIENATRETWKERERFWIEYFRNSGLDLLNITSGGDGYTPTQEISEKIRKALSGKKRGLFSDKWRQNMSLAKMGNKNNLGNKASDETKRKMSIARSGKGNPIYGKKRPPRVIEALRKANIGKSLSIEHKNKISLALSGIKRDDEFKLHASLGKQGRKRNNTSGYVGVSLLNGRGKKKWVARIGIAGFILYLGRFYTKEDAARIYNVAASLYFGESARLNPE